MLGQHSRVARVLVCIGIGARSIGCGSAAPAADPPSAPSSEPAPEPVVVPSAATPTAPVVAADSEASSTAAKSAETPPGDAAEPAQPPEASGASPEEAALAARANGPATGGPRGNRPCAFHESVDTYQRQCVATVNPDGSVLVSAKGTKLNPDHGFEFTLHGGDQNVWAAKGTLDAFGYCRGPFVARGTMSVDRGVKTYELRFKQHCMIVVR